MEKTTDDNLETLEPKVFISYSWTTQQHRDRVKEWADRLLLDGVEVTSDFYDLKAGQDKYAFMEQMVKDPNVTHVLIFCDKGYVEKADARKKGVGTESQIISQEIYEQVAQTKFIPIVCEYGEGDTPYLPVFLKSRIGFDFSSPEMVSRNWEGLVRHLYGKPRDEKPKLGEPPPYLKATATPPSLAYSKYNLLRQSILEAKPGVPLYRKEFLDACIEYADELRVRERPEVENLGQKVLEDCSKLVPVRDHIVDWALLESEVSSSENFSEALIDLLERLVELKTRPAELSQWNDVWFEAHRLFVYETFLYIIASLLKARAFKALHNVFTSHYLLPPAERYGGRQFRRFDGFLTHSDLLGQVLSTEGGQRYLSPAAELVKRQANRKDVPFSDLIQADLLAWLMSFIPPRTTWYPELMIYAPYGGEFPFFMRATQHKHFANLATITGIADADDLRAKVKEVLEQKSGIRWSNFSGGRSPDFWSVLNMDNLNTLN